MDNAFTYFSEYTQTAVLPPGWKSWREIMLKALDQAFDALRNQEVPVGAVLIDTHTGQIIGKGKNSPISLSDPTAHAEITALRMASKIRQNYRLPGTILAVTLEPCLMCLGALVQARIEGLVFGAKDPKAGAICSRVNYKQMDWINHKFWVLGGVLEQECGSLLKSFFALKRKQTDRA
ncbi:tRNA adenosine(34) deaminase TadA [Desulfovulcanus ferrireducens]|uniref:tRNA adenosine(34) deaminase TadA n=1 Tax=Desulfovulcanus ferrireducens TaxID=2831190 RepID=UPI00207B9D1C|nr:tRNA adenosine(34) deaminase TadA [Desulfovulcanus ferrireducens]